MKNLFLTILLLKLLFVEDVIAEQNNFICGGKYIGYDEQFVYLNWQKDKKKFKDKLFIKDKANGSLQVSLSTSDTLVIYPNKKYLSYWLYGKERIVYLCKTILLD